MNRLLLTLIVICMIIPSAFAWTDTGGGSHGGADWTPTDGLTISGNHTDIGTFTVLSGYIINVNPGNELEIHAYTVNIIGKIEGKGRGYPKATYDYDNGYGPGFGYGSTSVDNAPSGAGHASTGGLGIPSAVSAGIVYGSETDWSFLMGSSGGGGTQAMGGTSGAGGAAIKIIGNMVDVSGTIDCSGIVGGSTGGTAPAGAAGSGGTILLSAITIDISGTINVDGANGGSGTQEDGGSSSAGRIKFFYYTHLDISGSTITYDSGTWPQAGGGQGSYHTEQLTEPGEYKPEGKVTYDSVDLPNVQVTISNSTVSYQDLTDSSGNFAITEYLANGAYTVKIYKIGYVNVSHSYYINSTATDEFALSLMNFNLPSLLTPTQEQLFNLTTPVVKEEISFTWGDNATQYDIYIATDKEFGLGIVHVIVNTNSTVEELYIDDQYFWKVRIVDTDIDMYSNWSDTWNFSIATEDLPYSELAIHGIVYDLSTNEPIYGALVEIYNSTHSESMLTPASGYYLFENGDLNEGTYYLKATNSKYDESIIHTIVLVNDSITIENLGMQETLGSYDWKHYSRFVVCGIYFSYPRFENVEITMYIYGEPDVVRSGFTGSDGAIVFGLDKDIRYRITFESAEIDDFEKNLYPRDTTYFFIASYADPKVLDDDEFIYKNLETRVVSYDNNGTIHVSYSDSLDQTTNLVFYVNQTNISDIYNQTIIQQYSTFSNNSSATHIFTIADYPNQEYIVSIKYSHVSYGDRQIDYGISFGSAIEVIDGVFSPFIKGMFAIFILIFIGLAFGARSAEQGGLLVAVFAGVLHAMGWFAYFGNGTVISISIGVAIVIMFGANISKKSRQEMI